MAKNTFKKLAIGTAVAAAAGYIAGILTAPKSGRETREAVKDAADKTVSNAERQLKQLHTQAGELIAETKKHSGELHGRAKTNAQAAIEAAWAAKEKAREILSAVHEGEAEDKDLQRAITEITKAIGHLKKYLA